MKSPKLDLEVWDDVLLILYINFAVSILHMSFSCNRYKLENNRLVSGMCPDVVVSSDVRWGFWLVKHNFFSHYACKKIN